MLMYLTVGVKWSTDKVQLNGDLVIQLPRNLPGPALSNTIYDRMRVVDIASYTRDVAPLERIMRDAMVFPLYDRSNQGVRRRQLHDIMRHPGYDSMLAARGEGLPDDR